MTTDCSVAGGKQFKCGDFARCFVIPAGQACRKTGYCCYTTRRCPTDMARLRQPNKSNHMLGNQLCNMTELQPSTTPC